MIFLRTIFMILTLRCTQASQLLSRREDGPLTVGERLALKLHLLICGPCRRFQRFLDRLRLTIREFASATENESHLLSGPARDHIQQSLSKKD